MKLIWSVGSKVVLRFQAGGRYVSRLWSVTFWALRFWVMLRKHCQT